MGKEVRQRDTKYKKKLKNYNDIGCKAKKHTIKVGEEIVLKHEKTSKGGNP